MSQFERPAGHAPLAQDHGQRVHVAEQLVDLRAELLAPRVAVGQEAVDLLVGEPLRALDRAEQNSDDTRTPSGVNSRNAVFV